MKHSFWLGKSGLFFMIWVLGTLWFGIPAAGSQQGTGQEGADSLYYRARSLALDDHEYDQVIALCRELLREYPGYHDAWVLMGRSYAWMGLYSRAEQQLHFVLQKDPDYLDALNALVDVYRWWARVDLALQTVNSALGISPDNSDLLYKKALIQHRLGDKQGALHTLALLRTLDPGSRKAAQLRMNIARESLTQEVTVLYRHDRFATTDRSDTYIPWTETSAPWRFVSVAYSQEAKALTVLGQLHYAQRFGEQAIQTEIGVYPDLTRSTAGYLNFGYSPDPLFPEIRADAEVTQTLGAGFQVALGARYLDFNTDRVLLYTGTLSEYFAGYWINARGFLSRSETAFSRAWYVQIRRYFHDTNNYITLSGGIGPSPDQPTSKEEYQYLTARHFSVSGQQRLVGFTYLRWELRLANEEWERGQFREHATGVLGLVYRF